MGQVLTPSLIPQNLFNTQIADQNGYVRSKIWQYVFNTLGTPAAVPQTLTGTRAKHNTVSAANYQDGSLYYETDRTTWYVALGSAWLYLAGAMSAELGTNPAGVLPSDLGANDAGFLFWAFDYAHLLQWNGAMWQWAPGENGSGYIVSFSAQPASQSPGPGWHACDGSANVLTLASNGTLAKATLPNTAGSFYRQ